MLVEGEIRHGSFRAVVIHVIDVRRRLDVAQLRLVVGPLVWCRVAMGYGGLLQCTTVRDISSACAEAVSQKSKKST